MGAFGLVAVGQSVSHLGISGRSSEISSQAGTSPSECLDLPQRLPRSRWQGRMSTVEVVRFVATRLTGWRRVRHRLELRRCSARRSLRLHASLVAQPLSPRQRCRAQRETLPSSPALCLSALESADVFAAHLRRPFSLAHNNDGQTRCLSGSCRGIERR